MAAYDFDAPRLFVDADLAAGGTVELDRTASNYLLNVLRLGPGRGVLVFNGRAGEWRAAIGQAGRRDAVLTIGEQTRPQPAPADLLYLFAPLKHARLDYMVQKAVEMGVSGLRPVWTERTVPNRVNADRIRANAVEAAEQCGVLFVPPVAEPEKLGAALARLEPDRTLVVCDEDAPVGSPLPALRAVAPAGGLALLIGPEGGFGPAERDTILRRPGTVRLSLGPRILRADTAAVAALAVIQAAIGDWLRPDA